MRDLNLLEIAERFKPLYSALIYDTLEEFGYPDQAVSSAIKPLDKSMKVAGPAFTVRGSNSPKREQKETGLEMIQSLWPGCVLVMDTGNDYVDHEHGCPGSGVCRYCGRWRNSGFRLRDRDGLPGVFALSVSCRGVWPF